MKLNVLERLNLLDILPKQGDYTTLKIVRKLRETLSFSEEEHKKYQFRQEEGRLFWENDDEKDVHIGEMAMDMIQKALKKLDEDKKLTEEQFTLYEKFIKE